MSGFFIVFEGPDGSGTTKHANFLVERLQKCGKNVVFTREPTDGEHGKKVRVLLSSGEQLSPEEVQKLFCMDRADHVQNIIQPALDAGKIVVSDRFVPSTLIYGEVAGVPRENLEQWNIAFPKPDILLITMPPLDVCLERIHRRASIDVFEKDEFAVKVYEKYLQYAAEHPEALVVDTSGEKEKTADHVWELVGGVVE